MKLGLIAGNGRFPFLLLDAARAQGFAVTVAAIREETDPEINHRAASDEHITVHWLSLGELSRLIEVFQKDGVTMAVMAGQVKHKQIFSSIRPDWRLAKLLLNLRTRNTDMLLGAVAKVLGDEGIELISSTAFLEPLLAQEGVLTEAAPGGRAPDEEERKNIEYGLGVARAVAGFDIGQTVVVAAQACVAIEAMEGTDAAIERAGALMRTMEDGDGSACIHAGTAADRGEGREAESGYALRCARDWDGYGGDDDQGRSQLPVGRGRAYAAFRSRDAAETRREGRDCHCCRSPWILIAAHQPEPFPANSPSYQPEVPREKSSFLRFRRGIGARGGFIRYRPCGQRDDADRGTGCAHLHSALSGRVLRFRWTASAASGWFSTSTPRT